MDFPQIEKISEKKTEDEEEERKILLQVGKKGCTDTIVACWELNCCFWCERGLDNVQESSFAPDSSVNVMRPLHTKCCIVIIPTVIHYFRGRQPFVSSIQQYSKLSLFSHWISGPPPIGLGGFLCLPITIGIL